MRLPWLGMALLWLVLGASATAQIVTGGITGAVRNEAGAPLPGAVVTVSNRATSLERVGVTDEGGRYLVGSLPTEGDYEIRVALPGFAPAGRDRTTLVPGDTVVMDFTLRVAAAEVVDVQLAEPVLERRRSMVQQRVDEQMARALPLLNRNFLHLASLAAGFTGSPDFPNPQGQGYWANNVLVDGASHFSKWRSAPRTFYSGYGLESIREVQVLTNLFSAEFGDAMASVTSAVTKAGTNEWHGSGFLFLRDDALDSTPVFAARTPPAQAQQFGATVGGPLVRNRTHFFASYEGRRARDRNIVVSPAASGALVPSDQDEHLVFFRVDHQSGPRRVVTARYNGQRFRWHLEPGGIALPGAGTHYTNDVQTVLLTDAVQWSDRLLNETRAQFARYVDVRRDLQPGVYVSRAGYSWTGGALGPLGFGANPEDTWEASNTLSFWRGRHAVKLGGGARYVRAHNESLAYGQGAYFFAGPPESFPRPYLFMQGLASSPAATTADPRSVSGFGFVQDDWAVRENLTLNLGVRYDVENVFGVGGFDVPADTSNVQPRFGAAWDPTGDGTLVLRGGVGLYSQQHLLFPINRVQLEGAAGVRIVALDPTSSAFPTFPSALAALPPGAVLPPSDIQRVDRDFRNPYSLQYVVGGERLIWGTVVAIDWVRLEGRDLLSLLDANAPDSNPKPAQRTVAAADATRPLVPAPGTYRKIITLGNEGRSWYRALQIKARRTSGPLQAMATYAWAHAEDMGNYELPEDSLNLAAERARAQADVRHNVVVGATWMLPGAGPVRRGWSVSGIGVFRSNRPYTVTWGDDRNGTTQNDARPGGRSTGQSDSYSTVDLAVKRLFRTSRTTTEARLEAFNIFNTVNFDRYVGELSSPLFGQPVSAFPSRRLQLAAVLRF